MQLNPYLYFDGACEAAFKFYEKVLGAKIVTMMTHEGTPARNTCRRNGGTKSSMPA
jgi:PhnB protein